MGKSNDKVVEPPQHSAHSHSFMIVSVCMVDIAAQCFLKKGLSIQPFFPFLRYRHRQQQALWFYIQRGSSDFLRVIPSPSTNLVVRISLCCLQPTSKMIKNQYILMRAIPRYNIVQQVEQLLRKNIIATYFCKFVSLQLQKHEKEKSVLMVVTR